MFVSLGTKKKRRKKILESILCIHFSDYGVGCLAERNQTLMKRMAITIKKARPSHAERAFRINICQILSSIEPTDVAEVLTVGQIGILGEHAVSNLEAAGVLQFVLHLERVE